MRLIVVIATAGRDALVQRTLALIGEQTRPPHGIVVVTPAGSPLAAPPPEAAVPVACIGGPRGLPAQRNAGIDHALPDADALVFFDDDFLPEPDYLERVEALLIARPDVNVVTSHPVHDGARNAGFSFDEGLALLRALPPAPALSPHDVTCFTGAYGCNMTVRAAAIGDIRFDERLPLYAWQEDIDFTSRLRMRGGLVVSSPAIRGVHLGVKSGRVSGLRFGYSQVANPLYLAHKGSVPRGFLYRLMLRNIAANAGKALWPEPWVDRGGRLRGNVLALWHAARGRIEPEHILRL